MKVLKYASLNLGGIRCKQIRHQNKETLVNDQNLLFELVKALWVTWVLFYAIYLMCFLTSSLIMDLIVTKCKEIQMSGIQ